MSYWIILAIFVITLSGLLSKHSHSTITPPPYTPPPYTPLNSSYYHPLIILLLLPIMENNENIPTLAIVVPCYNEHEALPVSVPVLLKLLDKMTSQKMVSVHSFLLLSDDGSTDDTWFLIQKFNDMDKRVRGISLSKNRGQQAAMLAGMEIAANKADCVVTIDSDLQDDPDAIIEMVRDFRNGSEIVFGVRSSREEDSWMKRHTAWGFYKTQQALGLETVFDHSEFRLMSRKAIGMLLQYGESNFFMRGLVLQLGLKTSIVKFKRTQRVAGQTKYSFAKLASLSIDGVTSFTAKPMRYIFYTGLIFLVLDVFATIYVIVSMSLGANVKGWASIFLSVWFLGSLILMALGIIGEYIGKIFVEVKNRPKYFIDKEIGF